MKSFFAGMGACIVFAWTVWGLFNSVYHLSVASPQRTWFLIDWISVFPLLAVVAGLVGIMFWGMGEVLRGNLK
jgi:hypothetical protein